MKKQVSPVVTVIVILVVVVIVALLWTHFSQPARTAGGERGGFGGIALDPSKLKNVDLAKARKAAQAERDKLLEDRRSGRPPGS